MNISEGRLGPRFPVLRDPARSVDLEVVCRFVRFRFFDMEPFCGSGSMNANARASAARHHEACRRRPSRARQQRVRAPRRSPADQRAGRNSSQGVVRPSTAPLVYSSGTLPQVGSRCRRTGSAVAPGPKDTRTHAPRTRRMTQTRASSQSPIPSASTSRPPKAASAGRALKARL